MFLNILCSKEHYLLSCVETDYECTVHIDMEQVEDVRFNSHACLLIPLVGMLSGKEDGSFIQISQSLETILTFLSY